MTTLNFRSPLLIAFLFLGTVLISNGNDFYRLDAKAQVGEEKPLVVRNLQLSAPNTVTVQTFEGNCCVLITDLGYPTVTGGIEPYEITNNSMNIFYPGSQMVEWMVMDAAGNVAYAEQEVTVDDSGESKDLRIPGNVNMNFLSANNPYGAGPLGSVAKMVETRTGKLIAVGQFLGFDGTFLNNIVRLNQDGTVDHSFKSGKGADEVVSGVHILEDGRILIVGAFSSYDGHSRNGMAMLLPNGELDPTFDIGNTFSGSISDFRIQPTTGKIIAFGIDYTSGNKRDLIRLNLDGSVDPSFTLGTETADFAYFSIEVQDDGKILLGGFEVRNRISIPRMVRLNENGDLDETFVLDINLNGEVGRIRVADDGKIFAEGSFLNRNNIYTGPLIKLDSNGSLDASFNSTGQIFGAAFRGSIVDIVFLEDDKLLVVGSMNNGDPNSQKGGVMRLNRDGSLDNSFYQEYTTSSFVTSIVHAKDGRFYIAGNFSHFNLKLQPNIARLTKEGKLDESFRSMLRIGLYSFFVRKDKKILAATDHRFVNFYGSTPIKDFVRINPDGTLDPFTNQGSGADAEINLIADGLDDKILLGGYFTEFDGISRNRIARVNKDGSLDTSFDPGTGFDNFVNSIIQLEDGKILVSGSFTSYNGTPMKYFGKLNPDGSVDQEFKSGIGALSFFTSVTQLVNNKIYLFGGSNFEYDGIKTNMVRLNLDGTIDQDIGTDKFSSIQVNATAIQDDGKILVGGTFGIGANPRFQGIVRFNPDGEIDNTFDFFWDVENIPFRLNKIEVQKNGKIIIGGAFLGSYKGVPTNGILRLMPNGNLDNSFAYQADPWFKDNESYIQGVGSTALLDDGDIIIGGALFPINGLGIGSIAKLNGGEIDLGEVGISPEKEVLPEIERECLLELEELEIPKAIDMLGNRIDGVTDQTKFPISNQGINTITWVYTDLNGNTFSQEQTISIKDLIPPVIVAPTDLQIGVPNEGLSLTRPNIGVADASDNCELETVSNNAPELFELGITVVTWTAVDKAGNTTTDTQIVSVVNLLEQSISFPDIEDKLFGQLPFELNATSSSGLEVSFTVIEGPAIINGNMVTLSGAGTVIIQADQIGNDSYLPAESVTVTFCSNPPRPEIEIDGSQFSQNLKLRVKEALPGMNFQWQLNGLDLPDNNQPSIELFEAGIYRVRVYAGDCSNISDEVTLTNINDSENQTSSFKIYPNPFKNGFYVEGLTINQSYVLKLYDFKGALYLSKEVVYESKTWFDLNGIKPGNYILETIGHRFKGIQKLQVLE